MRFIKVLICIYILVLSVSAQNPNVDELIDRYISALGGKSAIEQINSRISKGISIDRRGNKQPVEHYLKAPDLALINLNPNSANEFKQWFDGTKGFSVDSQNGKREVTGAFLVHWKRNNNLHLPIKLKEVFPKIEFLEKRKKDGRELNCLKMTPPVPSEETWCFDDKTGLLYSRSFTAPTGKLEFIHENYREFNGVKFPMTVKVVDQNGTQTTEWQDIQINVPIDDAKFGQNSAKVENTAPIKPDNTKLYDIKTEEITTPSGQKYVTERGFLRVAENRLKQNSNTIEIAVMRIKSKAANPSTPLIYLAGGPGQSALAEARFPFMIQLFEQILQTRDVVLFDQRGVGQSKPVVVWRSEDSLPPDTFESEEKAVKFVRSQHEKAVASFKERDIDLMGYNTNESADDINDLRQAIGAKKINLLGFSYGTHLGLAAIRRHSQSLESVILLGTEGLNDTYKLPSVYDNQLKKLSELAAQDEAIKEKVPDLMTTLKRVLDKLEREPVTISVLDRRKNQPVEIKIGKYGLQFLIRLDVGDSNDFVDFPRWFYTMDKGDYSILKTYAERRYNQLGQGVSGMSVMMDLFSGGNKERLEQIKKESKDSVLGNAVNMMDLNIADIWGNPDLGDDYRKPLKTNIRTLFVSGTMDSNTPSEQTEEIRKGFSNSSFIILQYGGHEDYLPNQDIQKAIIDFLNGKDFGTQTINQAKPKFKPIP